MDDGAAIGRQEGGSNYEKASSTIWCPSISGTVNVTRTSSTVKGSASPCGTTSTLVTGRSVLTETGTSYNGVHVNWSAKKFWIRDITVVPEDPFTGLTTFVLEAEG